jgi:hypothetical protein
MHGDYNERAASERAPSLLLYSACTVRAHRKPALMQQRATTRVNSVRLLARRTARVIEYHVVQGARESIDIAQ